MIVVDACVVANALVDDHAAGNAARARLRGEELAAPDLVMVETAAVLRGLWLSRQISQERHSEAVIALETLPMELAPTRLFLKRGYSLRHNVTSYDSCYIALAEILQCPLVTADARMAQTPGATCNFEVLTDE
ncbi:MAG: type II toxin-antitoxin system VapC family toxin [Cellulomonadaceae bacterium]|jgi:predicted nucleic acid-binding protein|nr:type II toxin-antitoxin system VapC family toxin [Cellulomonadaceae bacterium]